MHTELDHADMAEPDEHEPTPPDASEHYFACPACGQAVDRRNLDEVLYHAQDGHRPAAIH